MRLVLSILILLAVQSADLAAQEEIGLFVDTNYEECKLVDSSPGLVSVYVVHSSPGGATASQFKLKTDSGVLLSYMGESSQYAAVIGSTQSGISIGYGSCLYSQILVSTVSYYATGGSTQCSSIHIVPDPASLTGTIEVVNCTSSMLEATGSRLVVNANGACDCGPLTENTNWGKIKNIYD